MTYMKTRMKTLSAIAAISTVALGSAALAGAPDADYDIEIKTVSSVESPDFEADARTTLSPAELRNAVEVQIDDLEETGFEIDREPYFGIGADDTPGETVMMDEAIRLSSLPESVPFDAWLSDPDVLGAEAFPEQ